MNVFFVSNSTCYYFADELYGMLAAAGHENSCLGLVYFSGCSIRRHYEWLQKGEANYSFRVTDGKGLHITKDYSLAEALSYKDWNVISFDNNARTFAAGEKEAALALTEPYFGLLFEHIQGRFPKARYLWHEVWANEIGYHRAFEMKTKEQRTQVYQAKRDVMEHMMMQYHIGGVPTGDAWEKVRDLPLFTDPSPLIPEAERLSLCSRMRKDRFLDDFSHDGDLGGGQYLNACVWFEILTGESCLGNSFRPQYLLAGKDVSLTEEKIRLLQNAAHEAVAEYRMLHQRLLG
jgi:hypothetical protein